MEVVYKGKKEQSAARYEAMLDRLETLCRRQGELIAQQKELIDGLTRRIGELEGIPLAHPVDAGGGRAGKAEDGKEE